MRMMRYALAAVAALTAAVPATAQQDGAQFAKKFAEVIQKDVPKDFGAGVRLVQAEAEGETIVFTMELSGENAGSMVPEEIAREFADGFCQTDGIQKIFDDGVRLRVDAKREEGVTKGLVIDSCP